MSEDSIKFNHWETGEEKSYVLKWGEHESTLICPFDSTPLAIYNKGAAPNSNYTFCPNCEINYGELTGRTQKKIDELAKQHFQELEKRLTEISNEQFKISRKLSIAKSKGLYGKVNKK